MSSDEHHEEAGDTSDGLELEEEDPLLRILLEAVNEMMHQAELQATERAGQAELQHNQAELLTDQLTRCADALELIAHQNAAAAASASALARQLAAALLEARSADPPTGG